MRSLPTISFAGKVGSIVLGGMGGLVGTPKLAATVANEGGVGTVSFVALDRYVEAKTGCKATPQEASRFAIEEAKGLRHDKAGPIFLNVMTLMNDYRPSVLGAVEAGADGIIAGAGLPTGLAEIVGDADIELWPIVSSARALAIICRYWAKRGRKPSGVIIEGPLAGGHLGFNFEDIYKPEYQLEAIFVDILRLCQEQDIHQIVVAGGIWDTADIVRWLDLGATGVQLGTRFLATEESGASDDFKAAIVKATAADIVVAMNPGSPSGMPFRVIADSPGYIQALRRDRQFRCMLKYMLHDGSCRATQSTDHFCICDGLLSAVGRHPDKSALALYTCGTNAARVDRIMTVKGLMDELKGITK